MLPFLQKKRDLGVILARIGKPDIEGHRPEVQGPDEEETDPVLEMACEDVIRALDDKSPSKLARALKSVFEIYDSMPHEEEGMHSDHDEQEME